MKALRIVPVVLVALAVGVVGSACVPTPPPFLTLNSPNPQAVALFGASVAVGDVNGDGKADIAVGARWEDVGGKNDQGRAYVLSGADGSLLFTLDMPPADAQAGAQFGYSVAMGYADDDGSVDIAVGAPYKDVGGGGNGTPPPTYSHQGRVYVFSGDGGYLLYTLDMPQEDWEAEAHFGYSLAMGHVESNMWEDIVVGAPEKDMGEGYEDQGRVYVFSGGSLLQALDMPPENAQSGASFGLSVAVGDVNNDQRGDVAVGAPLADAYDIADLGQAYVISAAGWSVLYTLDMPEANRQAEAHFGDSVAVGRVNADGYGDIAVGAPEENVSGNVDEGRAYVFSGFDGSQLPWSLPPIGQANAYLGEWLAIGDVDADGYGDIAAAADGLDVDGNADQGQAYVFSGNGGLPLLILNPPSPQAELYLGHGLAMGDVKGYGKINDGCPIQSDYADCDTNHDGDCVDPGESALCDNALDDDIDGMINDGCPIQGDYLDCDTNHDADCVDPGESALCDNALDDDHDGGVDIVVGAGGQDVGGNDKQGRAYVYSAGTYPGAATYHYTVQCSAAGVSVITPPGTPVPKGPFAANGTAEVTCTDPYWDNGHQCADCTIESLDCYGVLQGVSVNINRLPESTPVPGRTPVPPSTVHICEQSPTSTAQMVIFLEETDSDGGHRCSCYYEGTRWGSVECSGTTTGPGGDFLCESEVPTFDLCCCGGTGDETCSTLDTPRGGAFLLTGVGGIAEWPGADAGSDQSARSSSGSGLDYTGLAAAVAAVAVVAAGAWLARRRRAR